eukprot:Clim_evm2s248 gene=Clim_evmTU2s248
MGRKVIVKFVYEPEEPDELALQIGDVVEDVVDIEDDWAEGTLKGKRGVFPLNFVENAPEEKPRPAPVATKPPTNFGAKAASPRGSDASASRIGRSQSIGGRQVRALHAFEAQEEDELSFDAGELIVNVTDEDDEWLKGEVRGRVGIFPSSYVEDVTMQSPPPQLGSAAAPAEPEEGDDGRPRAPSTSKKPVGGVNVFGGFDPSKTFLKKTTSREAAEQPPPPKSTTNGSAAPDTRKAMKILHNFEAENSDELPLKAGDIVEVLEIDADDDQWAKGQCNGKKGLFPISYGEDCSNTLLPPLAGSAPTTKRAVPPPGEAKPAPAPAPAVAPAVSAKKPPVSATKPKPAAAAKPSTPGASNAPVKASTVAPSEEDEDLPTWKKELLARRKNRAGAGSLVSSAGKAQSPRSSPRTTAPAAAATPPVTAAAAAPPKPIAKPTPAAATPPAAASPPSGDDSATIAALKAEIAALKTGMRALEARLDAAGL